MRLGIALGANLGDRLANLRFGREQLVAQFGPAISAPVFETEPVNCPPNSPAFLNTVIELECDLQPEEILAITQRVENDAGRSDSKISNAPRQLDVDLLYLGETELNTTELTLPHPRLQLRKFVLNPLADICPDLILPNQSKTIRQLLTDLPVEEPDPICVAESW